MHIHEVGEFGLIRKISELLHLMYTPGVYIGLGDDAAVIRYKKDRYLLFTTDMLIEDVHFRLGKTGPFLIGRKALAVNISDIAAMGGVPKYGVVALGVPASSTVAFVREIYRGIKRLADKFKISIVGGDTDRSDKLIINISLIGEVEKKHLVLRSRAKLGDAIFVTGRLGGSLESDRHLKFMPRIKEAGFLTSNFKINSMIDISDGLTNDLMRILESSNVGASIEKKSIPISKNCDINNALVDGEDFELLFTIPQRYVDPILNKWPYKLKLTKIGRITEKKQIIELITKKGTKKIPEKGFRHF